MEEIKKLHMIAEYLQKKNKSEWAKLIENLIDYVETPKEWMPEDDCPDEEYIMTNDPDCF